MKRIETPQEYVNRILVDNGWAHSKVAERAQALGYKLSAGYVHNICRGDDVNPSIQIVKAIAAGLGRPEGEVMAVFRGLPLIEEKAYKDSLFAVLWNEYNQLNSKDQKELRPAIDMLHREIQRRTQGS